MGVASARQQVNRINSLMVGGHIVESKEGTQWAANQVLGRGLMW